MKQEVAQKKLARADAKIQALEKLAEGKTRELYLAHQEVEITNEYLQNVLRSMLTCLVVVDTTGIIKTVNRATLELLGYRMEELIGAPFDKISDPEGSGSRGEVNRVAAAVKLETTYKRKDGGTVPVLYSSSVLHDEEGEPQGMVCIALDITERKAAEQALKQAEEKYRTIFEHAIEGIFQTTLDGRFLSANPSLARIHGYDSVAELVSGTVDIAREVYVDPEKREQFKILIEDQGFVSNFQAQIRRRDRSIRWISENARLVRDEAGEPLYFEGTMEDITERKEAEEALHGSKEELEDANRQLKENQAQLLQSEKLASIGQLAAGVAHEINNPVGFISSNLGTMREYIEDLSGLIEIYSKLAACVRAGQHEEAGKLSLEIEKQKERIDLDYVLEDAANLLDESRDGAERVRKIVQDLREFSHVDQEEMMSANINEGVESTLNIVWNELKYKAKVEKDYGDIPEVLCFPMEINQVVMNILVNAAQAMEEQGTIRIETFHEDGYVCVAISDTGNGMSPEVRQRLFEPFFTTKEVGKGTGLGLNMAYNIVVNKHGGDILVDSQEGVGTTSTVKIPTS